MFLEDEDQTSLDDLNEKYVLVNFRPVVTKKNWRMDCGVAGYDNSFGLPPFFPTRLRFDDYIYRLWAQQEGLAAAHVDAAQNHIKSRVQNLGHGPGHVPFAAVSDSDRGLGAQATGLRW